jgi:hypothetical protein
MKDELDRAARAGVTPDLSALMSGESSLEIVRVPHIV